MTKPLQSIDDLIKDFGLEVSGGDFTQEHFLKYKKAIQDYVNREVCKARIEELQKVHDVWRRTYQSEKVQSNIETRLTALEAHL